MGTKYTTAELVSTISPAEAEVRCKLTWQEFDFCLWLASLSPLPELSAAKVVVDPSDFVAQRKHLVVGFSDQIPLWATPTGRKAVFAKDEVWQPHEVWQPVSNRFGHGLVESSWMDVLQWFGLFCPVFVLHSLDKREIVKELKFEKSTFIRDGRNPFCT